jgi:hypothetical protein
LRVRQSIKINPDPKELSPKQENALIKSNKDKIPELIGVPVTSFEVPTSKTQENLLIKSTRNKVDGLNAISIEDIEVLPSPTKQMGIFGVGLLAPRNNIPREYVTTTVSTRNIPIISKVSTSNYFFIIYDNLNIERTIVGNTLKSFAVIKTLSQLTVKDCSEMLRLHYTNITAISESDYLNGYFEHPKYSDDSGYPLQVRYAEIPVIRQKTPGRLDDIPLGYPDFDTTPDGVTTRKGPIPAPPYTNFTSATGATYNLITATGATVSFKDTSPNSPWQFAPTGWNWVFGPSASPTGSTAQNPMVSYNYAGDYTVTLTASNASGSTSKIKINFVTVTP